jgi:predicted RNA binding protein YcfA (HicA-like mRNA interferase family)
LKQIGYDVVRQKGSHVRLRHIGPPMHLISVPNHAALKVGTLRAILTEVARMRSIDPGSIAAML